jgi:hypothetical protein
MRFDMLSIIFLASFMLGVCELSGRNRYYVSTTKFVGRVGTTTDFLLLVGIFEAEKGSHRYRKNKWIKNSQIYPSQISTIQILNPKEI